MRDQIKNYNFHPERSITHSMKKTFIVLSVTLFIALTAKGQKLFFIGENSYTCTEAFTLKSNSDDGNDLNVLFAKDGAEALFAVSTKSIELTIFSGKLIIYLDDGSVITCNDNGKSERVDDASKAAYSLANEQLNKMRNSNINTVRYTLQFAGMRETNYSASNKGRSTKTDFPALITEFYE